MHCRKRRQGRLAYAASNAWPPLNLSFQCLLLLGGQGTAYQIAKIVDADDVVLRVLHRLIARQILFAEDRCLTIERFIPVDELDYLALRVENGTYGARAIIPLYVSRNAYIVCPALYQDRGGAADLLHDSINQAEIVVHLRGAKNTAGTALPSIVSVPSILVGPRISDTDFNKLMAAFTFCISWAPTTPSG